MKAVQRMLGRASAAMTLDVYAGLFGDDLDEVANRLDSLMPEIRPHLVDNRDVAVGELAARRLEDAERE